MSVHSLGGCSAHGPRLFPNLLPALLKRFALTLLALCACIVAHAQTLPWQAPHDATQTDAAIAALAQALLAQTPDDGSDAALAQRFRLQLASGDARAALASLQRLSALRRDAASPQRRADDLLYLVHARALLAADFERGYRDAFASTYAALDDRAAALAMRALSIDPAELRQSLQQSLQAAAARSSLPRDTALALVRLAVAARAFERAAALVPALVAQDDARRYLIQRDVVVPLRGTDAALCALIVRGRGAAPPRQPTLLNFTIYADPVANLNEARRSAANGYAGVIGLSRGKGCGRGTVTPYEHDGEDAAALIDWIAAQPWSDGRVGMYGGSYEGFTQWAAAKHRPRALKAMMASVSAAPGIDVPMEGNIFYSFVYYWPFYAASGKGLDNAAMQDRARWSAIFASWYAQGGAYRELDRLGGPPNPWFRRWLAHPGYDRYWQAMIPYRRQFAAIDLPVLTTTGYYDDAQPGALYYFREHHAWRPGANHYLLIGPYDHIRAQRGTVGPLGEARGTLRGYATDAAAQLDLGELRYQWFDHWFKGAPRPALLRDRVNYQVMGANRWKHAPSLQAMGRPQRFYLDAQRDDAGRYRLATAPPAPGEVAQRVDLADRRDAGQDAVGGDIVDRELDQHNRLVYASAPFATPVEISGLFSGRLQLVLNKRDVDLSIALYEQTAAGDYVQLSYRLLRASYLHDRSRRRLLHAGVPQTLDFAAERLTSRRLQAGSRLLAVVGPIKQAQLQINYGSGKDVSEETVDDAGVPLQLRWSSRSYLQIPLAVP
ncbi:CocE/NonD family hydrolase [Xanthomonas sp. AmX2]|nr:CocE/NonD family hydrolase [Xanthomonas sp.]MBN6150463.1 CocE/NonD family hydrolase [Xanthomonas sp.]